MVESRFTKRDRKTTSDHSTKLRAYGFRKADVSEFARFSKSSDSEAAASLISLADAEFNGKRISDWHLGRKRRKDWYYRAQEEVASRAEIAREFYLHHLGD